MAKCDICTIDHGGGELDFEPATLEIARARLVHWYDLHRHNNQAHANQMKRKDDEIARLHGRLAILKHENNKLRARLYPKGTQSAAPVAAPEKTR